MIERPADAGLPRAARLTSPTSTCRRRATPSGLDALPNGEAWYAFNARRRTTTDLTPAQIHQIGLDEVARIHGEIRRSWSRSASRARCRSSSSSCRPTRSSQLQGRRRRCSRTTARSKRRSTQKIPEQFSLTPKAPFEIRPVEPFRAQSAAGGSYMTPERGRQPSRHLLRQHLRPADAQDLGRGRPVPARGDPGPPLPARAAAGADGPAEVPPLRRRDRVQRRLGPVRRVAGQGAGRLHRSVQVLRLPAERAVARDPPGRRHRPAQQGLDPRAGDQVHAGQLRRERDPVDRRSRALHRDRRARRWRTRSAS